MDHGMRSAHRWAQAALTTADLTRPTTADVLSGRAFVCVAAVHGQGHLNAEGGYATIALCHALARKCARPGDVIFIVSSVRSQPHYGVSLRRHGARLLLGVLVVRGKFDPWVYHGAAAPDWAIDRVDRSYTARLLERTAAEQRDNARVLRDLGGDKCRAVRVRQRGAFRYEVKYKRRDHTTFVVEYVVRSRVRWHGRRTLHPVSVGARARDLS